MKTPRKTPTLYRGVHLATGLLLVSQAALAQDYRADAGASFTSGEICLGNSEYRPPDDYMIPVDPPPTGTPAEPPPTGLPTPPILEPTSTAGCVEDYDGFRVSGSMFLGAVDTSLGPLALAPFLSRASSIGGAYGKYEASDSDTDIDSWEIGGRFVTRQGIVFEAGYGSSEFDGDFNAIDLDTWNVAGGYYLGQNTQLRLGYDDEDADAFESERWAVDITHVQQLENGMAWSLNVLYGWVTGDDDGSDVLVAGEWFFRNDLSLGADVEMEERDIVGDLLAWSVHGTWFVTEKISVHLAWRNEDFDALDADADAFELEARYRF